MFFASQDELNDPSEMIPISVLYGKITNWKEFIKMIFEELYHNSYLKKAELGILLKSDYINKFVNEFLSYTRRRGHFARLLDARLIF